MKLFKFRILISFLALLLIGLSSCQSSRDISKEDSFSPCTDKLYLELQKRDSSTYTDFEKKYFLQKKEECISHVNKKEHDEKQEIGEKGVLVFVIVAGILGVALLSLLLSGYKQ